MLTNRQLFQLYQGQTSDSPLMIEIEKAEGIYMYGPNGESYIDLISGVSVSNIGHRHPKVVEAIHKQTDLYMHLMVYGEYVQSPQTKLAEKLVKLLPEKLNSCYFVNSGSEANEGALKLAKRYTKRSKLIAFNKAYHGSTHGALSVMGGETYKSAFRPLLPGISFLNFNAEDELGQIDDSVAAVIVEPIQGEAGIIVPENDFLIKLRKRCNETGTLLIFDEVQTAFGRTGKMFAYENYGVVPDIITFAKGLGGGMPLGAFVANKDVMNTLTNNPVLGHITTFGGHPVSCATANATLDVIVNEQLCKSAIYKGRKFRELLVHPAFKSIRGIGLFLAVELESYAFLRTFLNHSIELGAVFDWFIFEDRYFRITPPLTITEEEIIKTVDILKKAADRTLKMKKQK
ncbi:MAG: aspartate aminotransferase family protein [Bacteroidales bacterium]|nr:aspartate aminotransferase family protein [Bacteroidales bacterium]